METVRQFNSPHPDSSLKDLFGSTNSSQACRNAANWGESCTINIHKLLMASALLKRCLIFHLYVHFCGALRAVLSGWRFSFHICVCLSQQVPNRPKMCPEWFYKLPHWKGKSDVWHEHSCGSAVEKPSQSVFFCLSLYVALRWTDQGLPCPRWLTAVVGSSDPAQE